jgi:hypothetical protein
MPKFPNQRHYINPVGHFSPTGAYAHLLAKVEMQIGGPPPVSFIPLIVQMSDFILYAFDCKRGVSGSEIRSLLAQRSLKISDVDLEGLFAAIFGHTQNYGPKSNYHEWRHTYSLEGNLWLKTPGYYGYELIKKMKLKSNSVPDSPLLFYRRPDD